jgi:hypothetical protein
LPALGYWHLAVGGFYPKVLWAGLGKKEHFILESLTFEGGQQAFSTSGHCLFLPKSALSRNG